MTMTRFTSFLRLGLLVALLTGLALQPQFPVYAAANLTVTPITWNVIGLDSNNVSVGPNHFPIGARVCNTGDTPATNVSASFVWDSGNSYINIRPGTLSTLTASSLAVGVCTDFYFEVEVTRNSAAYDTTRNYHIQVTADGGLSASTPTPRTLYVEHLVSQSRNAVTDVRYGNTLADLALPASSVAPGGTMTLMVGNTYYIRLIGFTATQGYEQLESFINIPNVIFQTLSVTTTYTANTSGTVSSTNDKAYGDACVWENDPNSPNYRSCLSTGKVGGDITVTYQVRILQIPGAPLVNPAPLSTLIYDFSGSSFHYNADYDVSTRFANIVNASITKAFSPKTITPGQTSTLTFTVSNPGPAALTGVNFTDTLPASMTLANTTVTYIGCGAALPATLTVNGPPQSLSFSNITVAGLGKCTVVVNVTANTDAAYNNTSGSLFINSTTNTGSIATDTLVVSSQPAPPSTCTTRSPLATWTLENFTATTTASATGTYNASSLPGTGVTQGIATFIANGGSTTAITNPTTYPNAWGNNLQPSTTGNSGNSWGINTGWLGANPANPVTATTSYFQFRVDGASNYGGIGITASYNMQGNWSNSGNWYVLFSTDGTNWSNPTGGAGVWNRANSWQIAGITTNTTTTSPTVYFRVYAAGAQNSTATMYLDNINITGCPRPVVPTLSKAFLPVTIPQGSNSTLTLTLANPNATALTGGGFTDTLPTGLVIATPSGLTTTCTTGTLTGAPTAASGSSLISLSSATLSANANCTIAVSVRGNVAGQYTNISSSITSAETGPNTTGTGYGASSLTVVAPPVIAKSFTANPIFTGDSTTLTFSINNPNTATTLTGISFTDTLPAGLAVSDGTFNACGGTNNLTTTAAIGTVTLTGGTIIANGTCTINVTVTGTTTGLKNNSVTVSSTNGGTGNTDTAAVLVKDRTPAINLLKQVGPTATGPWTNFVAITPGVPAVYPQTVYFRFTIENTGDLALANVSITDVTIPGLDLADCAAVLTGGLALYETKTCVSGAVNVNADGAYLNTAYATGDTATSANSTARYATTGITLDKSAVQTSFTVAGDTLNYNYLVTNSGFASLLGPVTVTDDKVAVSCPAVTTVGDNDNWFDIGEQITCTSAYTVQPSDAAAGFVTNTASSAASGITSNTDSLLVNQIRPDLTVVKTNDVSGTIAQNGTFTWTLTVANGGNADAVFTNGQTLLSDPLPAGPTYGAPIAGNFTGVTNQANISCTVAAGTLSCTANGADVTIGIGGGFTLSFTVAPASVGSLTNTATVDPNGSITEGNETNNIGSDTLTVIAPPFISKSFGAATVNLGGTTALSFTLTNPNAATALNGVAFTDVLPAGLTVSDGTFDACGGTNNLTTTAATGTITLTGGTIIANGTCTFNVTVTGTTVGLKNNTTGNVTSTNGGTGNMASASTTVVAPELTVAKTNDVSGTIAQNGTFTWTLTVANGGNADAVFTNGQTLLSDPLPAGPTYGAPIAGNFTGVTNQANISCTVAAGTLSCTANGADVIIGIGGGFTLSFTVTPASVGSLTNTATVDPNGNVTESNETNNTGSDTVDATPVSDLVLTKALTTAGPFTPGQSVNFTITVANSGPSTATGLNVTDTDTNLTVTGVTSANFTCAGNAFPCTLASLANGASATITVTANVDAAGAFDNSATVTSITTDPDPTNNTDNDGGTAVANAAINVVKTSTTTVITTVGQLVPYTFTATNTGDITLTGIAVSDSMCDAAPTLQSGDTDNDTQLDLTETWIYTCNHTVTQAEVNAGGNLSNTVTADSNESGPDTDTLNIPVTQTPGLTQTKTAAPTTVTAVGDVVTYTFSVQNTGNLTLTNVTLSDTLLSGLNCTAIASLAPNATQSFTCTGNTYTITQTDIDTNGGGDGDLDNTATATATTPGGGTTTDTDSAAVTLPTPVPALTLIKTAAPTTVTAVGEAVTYTFSVQNTGNVTLTNVTITDSLLTGLNCTAIANLAPNATQIFTCTGNTYTVTQADVDNNGGGDGDLDNTATATATTPGGGTTTDTDSAAVILPAQTPALTLTKTATPTSVTAAGDVVTYTFSVQNTGNVTLTNIDMIDSLLGSLDCATISSLAPNAVQNFACTGNTYTITQTDIDNNGGGDGDLDNTAVATATTPGGGTTSDADSQAVTLPAQNPAINIVKSPATQTVLSGGTANFTLTVTNTGNVTLTGVMVTDTLCTTGPIRTGGDTNNDNQLQITETWTYSCSVAGVNASFTNTADVTTNEDATDSATANVIVALQQVDLELTKSVSNTLPPVATNITFTLTVTNMDAVDATNVLVRDVIPAGLSYMSDNSGGAYNISTGLWTVGTVPANSSRSLTITVFVNVSGLYTNYAEITAVDQVDPDSTPNNNSTNEDDDDSVTVTPTQNNPNLGKSVSGSNQTFTSNPNVAIGEIVEYTVTVNVPPGVFANARLVDTMERGLSFMACASITSSNAALTTDVAGSFPGACSAPTVDDAGGGTTVDAGRRVTFNLGTLTNSSAATQTLTFTYTVVVLDSAANVSNVALSNGAEWMSNAGTLPPAKTSVLVVEPDLSISKTANTSLVSVGSEITITLLIQHTAASETNAYDAVVADVLPAQLELVPGTLECVSGAQNANVCNYDVGTRTVSAVWSTFVRGGGNGQVTFRVRVVSLPSNGVSNTANVAWSSLPGDFSTPQNNNVFSTERGYDPASQIDVYRASDTLVIGVFSTTPATGFAPNVMTDLSNIRKESYAQTGGVTVEIPSLGINIPIVGVPLKNGEWNVSWLGDQAGWLEGSAFPSWSGNSVLTGHVYGANGLPGPFVNLNKLKYGDKIIIHAYGVTYTYEVRINSVVEPNDASIFRHEEKAWLTLVTCKEYDAKTNTYKKRVVVRAVLVSAGRE